MIDLVGGVVDELLAGLDALAAEDLTPLFGPALLERLRPLLAAQNRLAAEVARTVREAEVSAAAEVVTVDLDDLADPGTGRGAAHMGFGATISAARARWLACDGQVTRIVMGPDGMPLDHGRTLRLFPPHVRRAAEVRDGGCVFAGCAAPTWWCDVHHLLAWIDGGATDLADAALLCERHSHLVSTTASASNGKPTVGGAPGDPTAPRS